jgi:uncharacterized protein YecE (DUF72 family)
MRAFATCWQSDRRVRLWTYDKVIIVGTAGWSLPRSAGSKFAESGSHLSRYSKVLRGTEINSSFARSHSTKTYAKWASSTPRGFRFAVKMNRAITHDARLRRARKPLEQFLTEVAGLGSKLGPLLVQLPPSLEFDSRVARTFFDLIRQLYAGAIVCEPRHASWFVPRANDLLIEHHIGRVAADPASLDVASEPGGWLGPGQAVVYYRLHGSPRTYWSVYTLAQIERWARSLLALPRGSQAWCIFDNTAGGGAIENALQMTDRLG